MPTSYGNGKFTRSGGSLSDADVIFGGSSSYKTDRFGSSKSMSVTSSDRNYGGHHGSAASSNTYKIYEGIQNAAFTDYSDTKKTDSASSITSYSSWRNKPQEDDDDLDLK